MVAAAKVWVGPLSPGEVERALDELPPEERARLHWSRPAVRRAVDRLLEGELSEAAILQAAAEYGGVLGYLQRTLLRVLNLDPAEYQRDVVKRLQEWSPRLTEYLGNGEHAARLGRTLAAMFIIGALALREFSRDPRLAEQLPDLPQVDPAKPEGLGLRLLVLVAAILDSAERGVPVERARALIERADIEGWAIAYSLASEQFPGGPVVVPGYALEAKVTPNFQTELARSLWSQRQRVIEAEGGVLTDAEIEEEVAARRGGAGSGC